MPDENRVTYDTRRIYYAQLGDEYLSKNGYCLINELPEISVYRQYWFTVARRDNFCMGVFNLAADQICSIIGFNQQSYLFIIEHQDQSCEILIGEDGKYR